jgi:hypothetical protein
MGPASSHCALHVRLVVLLLLLLVVLLPAP